jgi:hypothetical protein
MSTNEDAPAQPRPAWWGLGVGLASGILGLLPWLATGERLPLQNLWRTQTLPGDMPWALLPLSQYYLGWIVGLLVVPSLVAGVTVSALRRPDLRLWAGPGALVVQVVAVVQSLAVLVTGLRPTSLMVVYIGALAVTCALAVGVGHLVFWQVTSGERPRVAMGLVLAAVPLGYWLRGLWALLFGQFRVPVWLSLATDWVPAVLVGVVLAWCAWYGESRVGVWIGGVLVVWLVPSAIDATGTAVARNTASQGLGAALEAWAQTFGMLAGIQGPGPLAAGLAILLGLVGVIAARLRPRAATTRPQV